MKNLFVNILIISSAIIINSCNDQTKDNSNRDIIADLRGSWRFFIGDDPVWSDPAFDDSNWELIKVPSFWEDQGFNGYDGYAWYRKKFTIDENSIYGGVYLSLGFIDDVDEVFINGNMIGKTGSFPPFYFTGYNSERKYFVPEQYLNKNGINLIAVRVYDDELGGGINSGLIAIEKTGTDKLPDFMLEGIWKFTAEDDSFYSKTDLDDSGWADVYVPSFWENQGFFKYDGFGWYRKDFILPPDLRYKDLVLILGRIDDIDQTYLNGKLIGTTGDFRSSPPVFNRSDEWQKLRAYKIPESLIDPEGKNIIAVRVYDGFRDGGIYSGPVGLLQQSRFTSFWKKLNESQQVQESKDIFELIFE
ncbi:MAG: hypothetical protein Kow0098_06590 [Ignavibacteriaceae bacterium]